MRALSQVAGLEPLGGEPELMQRCKLSATGVLPCSDLSPPPREVVFALRLMKLNGFGPQVVENFAAIALAVAVGAGQPSQGRQTGGIVRERGDAVLDAPEASLFVLVRQQGL